VPYIAEVERVMFSSSSKPVDPAQLQEMIPNSGKHSGNPAVEGRADASNGNAKVPLELPVLVSPGVVPQLREMAQRLVAAGYHAQCLKIYRYTMRGSLLGEGSGQLITGCTLAAGCVLNKEVMCFQ